MAFWINWFALRRTSLSESLVWRVTYTYRYVKRVDIMLFLIKLGNASKSFLTILNSRKSKLVFDYPSATTKYHILLQKFTNPFLQPPWNYDVQASRVNSVGFQWDPNKNGTLVSKPLKVIYPLMASMPQLICIWKQYWNATKDLNKTISLVKCK